MTQRTAFALGSRLKALGKSLGLQPSAYSLEPSPENAINLSGVKIALSCSGLEHVRRGVETWSHEAFLGLREQGVDVTLFQGSGHNATPSVRVLPCIRRNSRLSNALTRLLPSWSWRLGVGSAYQMEQSTFALNLFGLVRNRFEILHTKDPQVALLLHAAHRAGLSRAKVVLNHGTEEPPEFLNRFDYLQHLAPVRLEEAIRQGVRARRQFAIPNFVDTDKFSPGSGVALRRRLGIPQDAFVVLCVSAMRRRHKRIDWLLREIAGVAGQTPRPLYLLVAGATTPETDSLIRMGKELLGGRAIFLIDYPRERMPEVYRAADLFVLTSLKEMLSNASLEALASGLPCVMHREPVAQWAIGDGGETIDMQQPGTLAQALVHYHHPERRVPAGERARRQALARFSKDVVLSQQLEMYRAVMDDAATRARPRGRDTTHATRPA